MKNRVLVWCCCALGVLGGGVCFWLQGSRDPSLLTAQRLERPAPVADVDVEAPALAVVQRQEYEGPGLAQSDAKQGVSGRVLCPNGQPATNVIVYLTRHVGGGAMGGFLAAQGFTVKPVSQMRISADGRFRLGVQRPGVAYDVRVVGDDYPELVHPGVEVVDGLWVRVPDLQLEHGAFVRGRVTEVGTGVPIPGAVIYVRAAPASSGLAPLPGHEKGVSVQSDAGGNYRVGSAPRHGSVEVVVEAEGYLRLESSLRDLNRTAVSILDLQLLPVMQASYQDFASGDRAVIASMLREVPVRFRSPYNLVPGSRAVSVMLVCQVQWMRAGVVGLRAMSAGREIGLAPGECADFYYDPGWVREQFGVEAEAMAVGEVRTCVVHGSGFGGELWRRFLILPGPARE